MKSGGGSIAFCSSAVAQHGIPNHEAIAAAKAGVMGEVRMEGVDVKLSFPTPVLCCTVLCCAVHIE